MFIVNLQQRVSEFSMFGQSVRMYECIISMHSPETGTIITFKQVDDDEARADRRFNMWNALAEFDGGEGIEVEEGE